MYFGTTETVAVLRCQVPMLNRLYTVDVLNLVQSDGFIIGVLCMLNATTGEVVPLDLQLAENRVDLLQDPNYCLFVTCNLEVIDMLGH